MFSVTWFKFKLSTEGEGLLNVEGQGKVGHDENAVTMAKRTDSAEAGPPLFWTA